MHVRTHTITNYTLSISCPQIYRKARHYNHAKAAHLSCRVHAPTFQTHSGGRALLEVMRGPEVILAAVVQVQEPLQHGSGDIRALHFRLQQQPQRLGLAEGKERRVRLMSIWYSFSSRSRMVQGKPCLEWTDGTKMRHVSSKEFPPQADNK